MLLDILRDLRPNTIAFQQTFSFSSTYFVYRLDKFYGLVLTKFINDFIVMQIMGAIVKYVRRNITFIVPVKHKSPAQNVVTRHHTSIQLLPAAMRVVSTDMLFNCNWRHWKS